MDNLTHTLFGATLARTPLGRAGRGTTAALIVSSNIPDIDIVASSSGFLNYLAWHRGPTHGPLGVVGLGIAAALIVWIWQRRFGRTSETPASLAMLTGVSMLGVTGHILMDLPTSYGTRVLSPFNWHWFSIDWMPIVDIYLLGALAACLLLGRGSEAVRRRNAFVALLLMAVNYGVRGSAHYRAVTLAPEIFGPRLPALCKDPPAGWSLLNRWPAPTADEGRRPSNCTVEISAVPTFLSPFEWLLIAKLPSAYELRSIDLLHAGPKEAEASQQAPWRLSRRIPNQWTPAVMHAAESRVGRVFLGFSRFPSASSAIDADGHAVVRWTDLRFVNGTAGDQARSAQFSATVRVDAAGRVLSEALGP